MALPLDSAGAADVIEALRMSEERLRYALDAANEGLWDADIPSGRMYVNDRWLTQLGYSPGEARPATEVWRAALHPEDAPRILQLLDEFLQSGRDEHRTEHRIVTKAGELRWQRSAGKVVARDAQGRPLRMVGTNTDITERKRAEEQLRERQAALELSQALAHVGHWVWDTQTRRSTWSDEMMRIFGLDPATFRGDVDQMLARLVHPDDAAAVRAYNRMAASEQRAEGIEFRVVWPDGSIHHVWSMPVEPIRGDDGGILRVVGVVQDITERKRSEMLQKQLDRQERLAAVGQLAAGIAHDFNNILSIISIYAELLGESPRLTEKERSRANTVVEQTQRATRMIRQILDFSRQSVLEQVALDLRLLLKEQVKLLRQTLPENIETVFDCLPGEYWVLGDPTRMQQMVMNLAVNARDAMPEGGSLRIGLAHCVVGGDAIAEYAGYSDAQTISSGTWVQIEVEDGGMGMSPEVLARIYEPFFTTKPVGQGTGLGLAQVHGIVAQHHGHIQVSSTISAGTRFTILLPAYAPPQDVAGRRGQVMMPAGGGDRILVVEDDEALRVSLLELLQLWDYEVVEAANGEEALALLTGPAGSTVKLILSDGVMPRLGGLGLAKALRTRGITTPIVLISGHPLREERPSLQDLGIQAWLNKPMSSEALAEVIEDVLSRTSC